MWSKDVELKHASLTNSINGKVTAQITSSIEADCAYKFHSVRCGHKPCNSQDRLHVKSGMGSRILRRLCRTVEVDVTTVGMGPLDGPHATADATGDSSSISDKCVCGLSCTGVHGLNVLSEVGAGSIQ